MPNTDDLAGGLIPHALRAVGEGQSANAWARTLRESGAGVRRQVALRIYGQARAIAAEYGQEPLRPLDQVPAPTRDHPWPTREATGLLQTVQLFYRERVTGNIVQRFYNVKTAEGMTRQDAIDAAVNANVGNAVQYEQELVGAVHTGAVILQSSAAA